MGNLSSTAKQTTIVKSSLMKALVLEKYGPPSNLIYKDFEKPTITKPTQVLVKVTACGVNAGDCKLRSGAASLLLKLPMPCILGIDFAGIVEAVGSDVSNVKVGDEVYGQNEWPKGYGTYAEYCVLDQKVDSVLKKPTNITLQEASGIATAAMTAYGAVVNDGKLQANENKNVLIIGASGGIGSYAVQITKLLGSKATGICSTVNVDAVKGLGADAVLDYTKGDLKEKLTQTSDKFDLVIDCVGGKEYFDLVEPFMKDKAIYSTVNGPVKFNASEKVQFGFIWKTGTTLLYHKLFGRISYSMVNGLPTKYLEHITTWIEEGKLKPIQYRSFPLSEGVKAHEICDTSHPNGKIILVV